ncbi:ROK family transcriptional regulator [Pseudonocardia endophytica]|uniref:Putative NBD/HSP70 family sugar kinase n=1 Tax=Pseudonocardia endophytica TaxID=401976 RepID=A0A4R1HIT0_PSEEN|nr:ROK family transcriptional regulator [Pseudonocardia endophytica]TCK22167.1 putative NBD/HSP70 family sugar kinase [Pseudonocardia endophytica]
MTLARADVPTTRPEPPGDRRTSTASVVLRAVLDHGPLPRSTIARLTGLSGAAVSRQCAELSELGLLRERPVRPARAVVGRPHVPVDVDVRRHVVVGVHIALLHWTFVLTDLRGRVLAERRTPHRDPSPLAVLADIGSRTPTLLDEHAEGRAPLGVGVATGGWVDPESGVVVRHAQLGWTDVEVGRVLEDTLGIPVRVESHSRALAKAEQLIGDHRTRARSSQVHLFVGNVVDAAIATGDTVLHGPRSAAGDVSHLHTGAGTILPAASCPCGRSGCVQATVADRQLTAHVRRRNLLPDATFADVLTSLEANEPWAVDLFRDRIGLVARVVALLIDVINPEILVVSEAGLARRPELLDVLHAEVGRLSHARPDPADAVVASSFGPGALGVAASAVVLDETYSRPLWIQPVSVPRPART